MEEPENILSKIFNYINCSPSRNSAAELETKNIKRDLYDQPIQNTMNGFSSKAQMLHNSHRMSEQERGWFSVPQDYGWCYPPPGDPSKTSYTFSQPVWNVNKNCFEELSVYQEHNQAMQILPSQWVMENVEVESDYCLEIIMYEKSDQRLAAEILANSRLNPNAKEFTPKTVIEMTHEETEEDLKLQLDGEAEGAEEGQGDDLTVQDYICDITFSDEEQSSDEEDELEDEEEEDDWDWDSDEQSTGECVIVDPAEFEDLFTPSLLVTNLSSTCRCQEKPQPPPKLREANIRFLQMYPDQVKDDIGITSKTVKFSNDPTIIVEPENLAEELQLARIGEFAARQADRERMERLLGLILTETHRKNVYRRIYGQPLYE